MEPAVTALVELAMTLGVRAVIYERGRSMAPWMLNKSHRSDGDVSVMVSRFFVCRRLLGKRRGREKIDIDVACRLLNFENI
eukprot:scaffold51058_cov50-Cyclotella_meneghiniana.AAC.2